MTKVHIDFETRSICDLIACGPHRYAQDPSTSILCVAYAVDNEDPELIIFLSGCHLEIDKIFKLADDPAVEFHAFNASFESSIWSEQMVKKLKFPPIAPERWHCTASQAYAVSLPRSMDAVATVLKLDSQKDKAGAALMRRLCIHKSLPFPDIDPDDLERLGEYCIQDVVVERAIAAALPPLSAHEQAIYTVDQIINKRGVEIDAKLVENAVEMVDKCIEAANSELVDITDGAVRTIGQAKAIQNFANSRGVDIGSCTAKALDKELEKEDLDPLVRRVFTLRRSTGRAAVKKYAAMLKAMCSDRRIRDHLMYCGAGRTRRWSGQRLQTQNITRGYEEPYDIDAACAVLASGDTTLATALFGDPMLMLSGLVRSMIRAKAGKEFLVADYSSIEARVLAVVSGNKPMLEDYAKGLDPYISFAALIFNVQYNQVTKLQRFFGKQAILGLGYGMGFKKFRETCANYGQDISLEFAEKVVTLYREKNHMVPALWRQIEKDAKDVISGRRIGIEREHYSFFINDKYAVTALVMVLPNGSERWYINPRIEVKEKWGKDQPTILYDGVNSIAGKWEELETYGGKLAENSVQSIARELQAEALLAVERAGLPGVLHAHDEVACETSKGATDVNCLIRLMTTASPWASSWPIDADGWKGPRYKK